MSKFDQILKDPAGYMAQQSAMNPKVAGQSYDYWLKKLAPSDQDYAEMMQNLLMNIGSMKRQGYNQAAETAAQYDLTPGAEMALQNRVGLQANRATQEGTVALNEYKDEATRKAWANIMGTKEGEMQWTANLNAQKDLADSQFWGELLGGLGQSAGTLLGIPKVPKLEGVTG